MKKTSLASALFMAGAFAVAGAAHADAIFFPDGTMIDLGPDGAEMLALDQPVVDTTVLGAPAATVTTVMPSQVYVQPNIHANTVIGMPGPSVELSAAERRDATPTFDVPAQAGEASTMTEGRPNLETTNSPHGDHHVVGATTVIGVSPATVLDTTVIGAAPVTIIDNTVMGAAPATLGLSGPSEMERRDATPTFDVPAQAGEASTMTEGQPNMMTTNKDIVIGVPYLLIDGTHYIIR